MSDDFVDYLQRLLGRARDFPVGRNIPLFDMRDFGDKTTY